MAMSKAVLSDDMKAKLIAAFGAPEDEAELQKMTDAIAEAVINHITGSGVVTVTGVTAGSATVPGTIT